MKRRMNPGSADSPISCAGRLPRYRTQTIRYASAPRSRALRRDPSNPNGAGHGTGEALVSNGQRVVPTSDQ